MMFSMVKKYLYQGFTFEVKYDKPAFLKNKTESQRGRINLINPNTNEKVTKGEFYTTTNTNLLDKTVYGKNIKDVERNIEKTFEYIIAKIQEKDFEQSVCICDLAYYAEKYKEEIFNLNIDKWNKDTRKSYSKLYDENSEYLKNIAPEKLSDEKFISIQKEICNKAALSSDKYKDIDSGEISPKAQKQLNLLCVLIRFLAEEIGVNIDVNIDHIKNQVSHTEKILKKTDGARYIPDAVLKDIYLNENISLQNLLYIDCGIRTSENAGLLWGNLKRINGTQGYMYYLEIVGQIDDTGKRKNTLKTENGYRIMPLTCTLGEKLYAEKLRLKEKYKDADSRLMCYSFEPNAEEYSESLIYKNNMNEIIKSILEENIGEIIKQRFITFDKKIQDNYLKNLLTPYSLRRNFCTRLHCGSSWNTKEIYNQMGHSNKNNKKQKHQRGLTNDDIYKLCLKKQEQNNIFGEYKGLKYTSKNGKTDIKTCKLNLSVAPYTETEIVLETWFADTNIIFNTDKVTVEKQSSFSQYTEKENPAYNPELFEIESMENPFA